MVKSKPPYPDKLYNKVNQRFISENKEINPSKRSNFLSMLILVTDDGIGDRNSALSSNLKIGLIHALAEKEPYPSVIVFMNKGVFLTLENAACIEDLRKLESKGVLLLSNCSCLDYYKVMDKLAVGGVTNMYHIAELIKLSKNTVTL